MQTFDQALGNDLNFDDEGFDEEVEHELEKLWADKAKAPTPERTLKAKAAVTPKRRITTKARSSSGSPVKDLPQDNCAQLRATGLVPAAHAGLKTIEWLFREQLRVDAEWSVKFSNGFTWWADRHAQTIEIVGSETDESGETAYLIATRTEMLRNSLTGNIDEAARGWAI